MFIIYKTGFGVTDPEYRGPFKTWKEAAAAAPADDWRNTWQVAALVPLHKPCWKIREESNAQRKSPS
jgi:hypothetical protein